jgi:hypothetical protein
VVEGPPRLLFSWLRLHQPVMATGPMAVVLVFLWWACVGGLLGLLLGLGNSTLAGRAGATLSHFLRALGLGRLATLFTVS